MEGYIKLSRKLLENALWNEKPFSRAQAWVDLLMLANWKDSKVMNGDEVQVIKRGTVARSQKWLADRWGWDRKKVARFLRVLESDEMVTVNGATNGTTITIENYSKYQDEGSTDGTTSAHPMGQRVTINSPHIKNSNKSKNRKNYIQRENKEKVEDDIVDLKFADGETVHYVNGVRQYSLEESREIMKTAHEGWLETKRRLGMS